MKTIALEESIYAKLSRLKAGINERGGLSLKFSELIDELIRRPLGLFLFESDLSHALMSVTEQLSIDERIFGIILFGSVAKLKYESNSDIDIFIIVKENSTSIFDYIEKIILDVEMEYFELLAKKKLPSQFSPFISSKESLGAVKPIFFDIADYGIILYDKGRTASDFVENYLSMNHRREYTENGEILTWQT